MPQTSNLWTTRADGSVMISNVKQAGAIKTSLGWVINPNGTLYESGTRAPHGAALATSGFTFNPDGGLVLSATKTGSYANMHGFTIGSNGGVYVSATKSGGAYLTSYGVWINNDGSLFAY